MEPWQSWAAALALGGAAFYYYAKPAQAKGGRRSSLVEQAQQVPQQIQQATRKQKEKRTAKGAEANVVRDVQDKVKDSVDAVAQAVTGREQVSAKQNKKRKPESASKPASSQPAAAAPVAAAADDNDDDDQGMDDKEWARQLEARKKGVQLTSSSAQAGSGRTKKQNAQARKLEQDGFAASSGAESTTSSTASPAVRASAGRSGVDVSDMLEPTAAAPSILRITGEEKAKKAQPAKAEEDKETKKQRQNRRKNEEAKLQREEDEKRRQVLLEQQRRTAREARGEPAKNGLGTAQTPTASAWSGQASSNATPSTQSGLNSVELLDTLGDGTSNGASTAFESISEAPAQDNAATGWSEVATGKKGKKKTNATEVGTAEPKKEFNIVQAPSVPVAAAKPKSSANGYAALMQETSFVPRTKGHPEDSDWAVE